MSIIESIAIGYVSWSIIIFFIIFFAVEYKSVKQLIGIVIFWPILLVAYGVAGAYEIIKGIFWDFSKFQ